MTARKASETKVEQVYVIRSPQINASGRLFGGCLMQWMDEAASVVARRHARGTVTTVAVDNLHFKKGAFANDTVVIVAKLSYVGGSSMEIRVDVYREEFDGMRESINTAYFIMVALDENGKPVTVPRLRPETDEERNEWNAGARRYELRKQRVREGY